MDDIYESPNEDTYTRFSNVVSAITLLSQKYQKEVSEQEKLKKLAKKVEEENIKSHADDNEGADIY